jgi:hypothetical protein
MKQTVMSIAALILLSTAAMAQDNQGQRPEGQRLDRTEMIQRRTDRVVQQYGLNAEQAKQLLSLNTKFADQMGPRGRRPNGQPGGPGMRRGQGQGQPQAGDTARVRRQRPPQMDGQMNEYETELQKILTPDQYKAYKADQEQRMRQFGGQRGQRGQRPNRQ